MSVDADWRTARGMTPKARRNCPVCGVESYVGRACRSHKRTEKRTEYHAAYYRVNRAKLAEAARLRKARARLLARLRPLIDDLNRAVDLGRESARW